MFAKNQLQPALFFVLALLLPHLGHSQCSALVDLNTWSPGALASAGNWVVNGAGTSVTQTINGQPAFFVSPQSFINVRMRGQFRTTGTDDDFMGFVFGWQDPPLVSGNIYDFDAYLYDWSQTPHASPAPGHYLTRLDGNLALNTTQWWQHAPNTPEWQTLGYDPAGWTINTVYNFELTYLTDRIVLVINNDTIFDINGCFQPGKFGFYNYSQASVIYSNFSYDILADFGIASNNVCVDDSASFFYINSACATASGAASTISAFNWNFGDGNTSNNINPNHLYSNPGTYNVSLEVVDFLGCRDTVTEVITIFPRPATPVPTNNGPLCENSTLNLATGAVPGGTYSWTGPNGFTSTLQNPSLPSAQDNATGNYFVVVTDANNCTSLGSGTPVTVFDTPLAPTAGNSGPVCADSAITLNASTAQPGATYTWSGPNSFTSTQPNPTIANPTPGASGNYSVFTTINGCPGPATTTNVVINATPSVTVTGAQQICDGQSTTLTASGATSYAWSNAVNGANNTVNPTTTTSYSVVGTSSAGCPAPAVPVTVTVNPLPNINLGPDQVVCDGVVLDAGPAPSFYSWSSGQSTQSILAATSGTYTVTGTDSNTCVASDTVNITVNNTVQANLGPTANICPGDSVLLVSNPNTFNSYSWSTSATNPSIWVNAQGTYYLDVVDANGCPSSDTVFVNVYPTPVVNVSGNQQLCFGESTTLSANGASSYAWSNGLSTSIITVSPTGDTTYSVVGTTSTGCVSAPTSVFITVDSLPSINLGADTTVCDGIVLDAGTSANNYSWGGGQTTQTLPVTASGTYTVTISNSATCTNADTISVVVNNTVVPDLGNDQDLCPGSTTTLATNPSNFTGYTWSTAATTPTITVGTTGIYSVNTVDGNGCPASDSVFINVFPLLSGNIGADTLLCNGDSITFDASSWAGATYAWSNGATTPAITVNSPGTYAVAIDDGNGCGYADTISLAIDVPPVLTLSVSDTVRCAGDPITFTVSPASAANYDFLNGGNSVASGPSATFTTTSLQPGNSFQVLGTTAAGCPTAPTNILSVNILPRPSGTTNADTVCLGFPTTLSVNATATQNITWTGTGGLSGTTATLSHVYAAPGTYTYSVLLDNGPCDTTIFGTVEVLGQPQAVGSQDVVACIGEDATLAVTGGPGTIEWYDVPAGGSPVLSGTDQLQVPGAVLSDTFYVQEVLTGCVGPRTPIVLEVVNNPVAAFLASPDTSVILNIPQSDIQFVNLSTGANTYSWDFGDGNSSTDISPIHNYTEPGTYTVTLVAITSANCQDTITLGPFEAQDFEGFSAPSGFTPNGDGDNETWVIDDLFFYPNNSLAIFNRWGDQVFAADRYQNDWDGTHNGKPLPEGTYYWVIDLGDGSEVVKGFVVLFR